MQTRTAFFLAMLIAAGPPLAAEPNRCQGSEGLSREHGLGSTCTLSARTPHALNADTQGRELGKLASYAAIGNRTQMEIMSRELREFGVSADELRDAAAQMWPRAHLHGSSAPETETNERPGS